MAGGSELATPGRDGQRLAQHPHPQVADPAEPLHQDGDRHPLDGVQVRDTATGHRVLTRLEKHLGRESAQVGGAGSDQGPTKARDGWVPRQHDDRPATDLGQLAPPHLAARGKCLHEAPAASVQDARSPHSSGSSMGKVSYAA